jgi:hypothetical protein
MVNWANTINNISSTMIKWNICDGDNGWYQWTDCIFTWIWLTREESAPLKLLTSNFWVWSVYSISSWNWYIMRWWRSPWVNSVYTLFSGGDVSEAMRWFRCAYMK